MVMITTISAYYGESPLVIMVMMMIMVGLKIMVMMMVGLKIMVMIMSI